jgi:hypothetical protein
MKIPTVSSFDWIKASINSSQTAKISAKWINFDIGNNVRFGFSFFGFFILCPFE